MLNTMFLSHRIAITPFQFSYRISLPLEQIFFGMIFVIERGWNALIGNTSGTTLEYDFEFKSKPNINETFFNEV